MRGRHQDPPAYQGRNPTKCKLHVTGDGQGGGQEGQDAGGPGDIEEVSFCAPDRNHHGFASVVTARAGGGCVRLMARRTQERLKSRRGWPSPCASRTSRRGSEGVTASYRRGGGHLTRFRKLQARHHYREASEPAGDKGKCGEVCWRRR